MTKQVQPPTRTRRTPKLRSLLQGVHVNLKAPSDTPWTSTTGKRQPPHTQREGKLRVYENNAKTAAQRAATHTQHRHTPGHTLALSEYPCSKPGIELAHRSDYTYKKHSTRKTFMIGAMKPVSLPFDQPT